MNLNYSKSLGLIAVLYFTASINAQQVQDTVKEKKIEEVVVIGYGAVKKENLTSAVSSVGEGQIENRPIYNAAQALQGNAAGVTVVQPSGKPGKAMDVKIRGNNSITSGVNPLYVIDGMQTNDLNGINPNDIVEMTILKDATATAIYGTSGSAGVVIITTRKAKKGQSNLNFNAYWGVSKAVKNIDVLNLDQYKDLLRDLKTFNNLNYIETAEDPKYAGINTNWRDEVYQTGFDQNYNVNYNIGTEKVKVYTNLGYQNIDGVIKPASLKRVTAKANVDADITSWLRLTSSLNYFTTNLKNTSDNIGVSRGGVVLGALNTPAFLPVYAQGLTDRSSYYDMTTGQYQDGYKDGQFALNPYQSSWENPVAYQSRKNETNDYRYMTFLNLEAKILPGLTWKTAFSYDYIDSDNVQFIDPYTSSYGRQQKGTGSHNTYLFQNVFLENFATYKLKKGISDIELIGGTTAQWKHNKYYGWEGQGFEQDVVDFNYNLAETKREKYSNSAVRNLSYFGRLVYTLNGKYTIMGVARYNGTSSIATDNRWGFFPGVSASWLISKENFLRNNRTISQLKLRGGWGKTANISQIPEYSNRTLESLNYVNSEVGVWNLSQMGSGSLTWEETADTNLGLDLALFDNRIKFSADAYYRKTDQLILPYDFSGTPTIRKNLGSMENKGLEFTLNTQNFKGDFTWNTNFNISMNKNKITDFKFVSEKTILERATIETVGGSLVRQALGQAVGSFYGYQFTGVDAQTGSSTYADLNGNGILDAGDRTFIGNPNPKFTFGFTNNFSYKNVFLDVLITGSYGNDIYNATRFDLELMNDFKNQSTAVLDRWTTPGQITDIPRAGDPNALVISDRFLEDGSYLRLKSLTLGYKFNKPVLGTKEFSIYATAQNLLTWTDYSGFDPEVNAFDGTPGVFGIDYGTYPQVKTFIFGIKANF